MGLGEDVTRSRSGSGRLDFGWNFSGDKCGVSDEEGREVAEVMNLVSSVDDIWWNVGDSVIVWKFGRVVGELRKKINISGWRVLQWLAVIEIKMTGKMFETKESFTWVREMEVTVWLMIIAISMIMITLMIVGITGRTMFR